MRATSRTRRSTWCWEPTWRPEGSVGAVGGANGRGEALAAGADGVAEPGREGHLYRLRGWAERISGSDRGSVSTYRGAVMHRAFSAGLAQLCALESTQASSGRLAVDLPCRYGG